MPITGKLRNTIGLKGGIKQKKSIQAKSMSYTPSLKLSDLQDIDTTNREDGSVLIWDNTTQTFKVQGIVQNDNIFIIGGTF
jgi:hypothetical protein